MPLSEEQIDAYVAQSGLPEDEKDRLRDLLKSGTLHGFVAPDQHLIKQIAKRSFRDGVNFALNRVEDTTRTVRLAPLVGALSDGSQPPAEPEADDGSWITKAEGQLPEVQIVDRWVPHVRQAIRYLTGEGSSNPRQSAKMAVSILREIVPPLPLPTEAHTVIRVFWKSTRRSNVLRLDDETGRWQNETGFSYTAHDVLKDIVHWEPLSRPV